VSGCLELAAEESERLLIDLTNSIDDFICQALRGEPAPWTVPGNPNATEFLARCRHHGVVALLFHRMRNNPDWQSWPLELQQELEQASKAGAAHDLLRTHYLRQLLNALAAKDIPCITTKGEALAVSVYKQPGTRPRSDSDLFIRMGDIAGVRQTVLDLGYRVASTVYKSHQFTVVRPGDESYSIRFDIHWRILNSPRFARVLSFEEAFEGSREAPGMSPMRILNDSNALMLACMHRFGSERHDRDRLIWIYDVHELIMAMDSREFFRFAGRAVERSVQDVCLDAILKSEACFHTVVPPQVIAQLQTPGSKPSNSRRFTESHLGLLLVDWKELPNRQARAELLRELFIPPGAYLLHKYQKNNRLWLPVLYLRQWLGGVYDRLLLK
jgi:hypothetical protein